MFSACYNLVFWRQQRLWHDLSGRVLLETNDTNSVYPFGTCSYVYHFLEWLLSYNIKYYTLTSGARWFFADLLKTWLPMLLSFSPSRTVIDRRKRKKRRRRHVAERTHIHARERARYRLKLDCGRRRRPDAAKSRMRQERRTCPKKGASSRRTFNILDIADDRR